MKKAIYIPVVILRTKTGYNGFSPIVEGCVVTDRTVEKTLERMKEALAFHLEGEHLIKQSTERKAQDIIRKSFDNYGTDAVYAAGAAYRLSAEFCGERWVCGPGASASR